MEPLSTRPSEDVSVFGTALCRLAALCQPEISSDDGASMEARRLQHCEEGCVSVPNFQLATSYDCHDSKWNKPKLDCRPLIRVDPGKEPQTKRRHLAV